MLSMASATLASVPWDAQSSPNSFNRMPTISIVTVMPRAPNMTSGFLPTVSMSGMLMIVPISWVTLMIPAWMSWLS